jgi:hypothetical protein
VCVGEVGRAERLDEDGRFGPSHLQPEVGARDRCGQECGAPRCALAVVDTSDLSWTLHAGVERQQDVESFPAVPLVGWSSVSSDRFVSKRGGGEVPIKRGISRTLLIALLLRARETVELLWGDDQPRNPANALQIQISYLRKTLSSGSASA